MIKQDLTSGDTDATVALVTLSARLGRAMSRVSLVEVPAATLRLLSLLDELAPVGISSLADADRCSQPTMSTAVQQLVAKGWATKTPHPTDARASLVALTPAGATVLNGARRRISDVLLQRLAADPCHDVADVERAVLLLHHLLRSEEGTS